MERKRQCTAKTLGGDTVQGLGEAFVEFVKSLAPKSFKQKLEEKKADAAEQNRQRKITQQEMPNKKKKLQQEM